MKFLRLLFVPFALACVAVIRLIRPWKRIRFGALMANRIGHLSGNTEVYLCERAAAENKCLDIWTPWGEVSNAQYLKMLGRCMTIDTSRFSQLVMLCNKLFKQWEWHEIPPGTLDRDPGNLLEKYPPHLHFTAREEAQGEQELQAMGIPAGAKWVCLIVRDAAYLPGLPYHSYRDADVDNYAEAALALAERGYYVLRMGAKVAKPFAAKHPRIIDYAANGMRSDFRDVYLGAKCEFCVSTGCGFDGIPYAFRRPICYTNYVPFEYFFTFANKSIAIWKHHEKDGKRMGLEELFKSGAGQFMRADQFAEAGIKLIDNTPQELTAAVLEMIDRDYSPQDNIQQAEFWKLYPRKISEHTTMPLHGQIRMRIGREFLREYNDR